MARQDDSVLVARLKQSLPAELIDEQAREVGALVRQRRVDVVALVWTLVFGWGAGASASLAALQRSYERHTRTKLSASSFHQRLKNPALLALLRTLWAHASKTQPRRALGAFEQVLALDSSFLRLWRGLLDDWPSSNPGQAGARLQMVVNVSDFTPNAVILHDAIQNERQSWKTLGPWLRGALLLIDLGYYDYSFFARVADHAGFFLSRARRDCALTVVEVSDPRERHLIGLKLKDALAQTRREQLELRVCGSYRRPDKKPRRFEFRALAHRHPDGDMRAWLTNAPTCRVALEDAPTLYALRWQVELMFKGMKSLGRLSAIPTSDETIMRVLILASLLFILCCGWLREHCFGAQKLWTSSALRTMCVVREMSELVLEHLIAPRRTDTSLSLDQLLLAQLARPSPCRPNAFSIPCVVEPLSLQVA